MWEYGIARLRIKHSSQQTESRKELAASKYIDSRGSDPCFAAIFERIGPHRTVNATRRDHFGTFIDARDRRKLVETRPRWFRRPGNRTLTFSTAAAFGWRQRVVGIRNRRSTKRHHFNRLALRTHAPDEDAAHGLAWPAAARPKDHGAVVVDGRLIET